MDRDELTVKVADNIALLMEARGLDAAKLARRAGLNPTGIYDILSGKSRSPKIETIGKIAAGLDVPVAVIFEDDPLATLRNDLLALYEELPEDRRALLLQTARAWRTRPESA